MKILVTGGAGFVGSHLGDRLLADGHQLTVVDDLSTGRREQVPELATFHRLDLRSSWLTRLMVRAAPEVIFHLAAQIDVRRSVADPLHDAAVNVMGSVQLLQAAAAAKARRVVFISSGGAVYGDTEQIPTPETHPLLPASPYGAAKAAGEAYLAAFRESFGLETVILRPGNIYGPRQDPHGEAGVVAIFAEQLLSGRVPVIFGDGQQQRDYLYVEDLAELALRCLDGPSGIYNAGTGVATSVLEICRTLSAEISRLNPTVRPPEPRFGPARAGEQRVSCLDPRLAQRVLQWVPGTSLEEGLQRTVRYFADRR